MDPEMIKRFLASPNEFQKVLKKINASNNREGPALAMDAVIAFILIEDVAEFERYLLDRGSVNFRKFKPEFLPMLEASEEDGEGVEKIYGYKELKLNFLINARTLHLHLDIICQIEGNVSISVDDLVAKVLAGFDEIDLSKLKDPSSFRQSLTDKSLKEELGISNDAAKMVFIFTNEHETRLAVSEGSEKPLSAEDDARLVSAIITLQFLVPFFIETGSKIDYTDSNWSYLLSFEGQRVTGFLSFYKFYVNYCDFKLRISQVFVFPPDQRKGIGFKLVERLYCWCLGNAACKMVTVEDPNNSFLNIQFRILINLALKCAEETGLSALFNWLDEHKTTGIEGFDLARLEKQLSENLKTSRTRMATALDAIILWHLSRKNRRLDFMPYLRGKIRQKLDRESAKLLAKQNSKVLVFDGERLMADEIKTALESYSEAELSDLNSMFQQRMEALESLMQHLKIEN